MDVGGAPAEFSVLNCDCGRSDRGPTKELKVEGLSVRLVLGGEGGIEVKGSDREDDGGNVAPMRYCGGMSGKV